MRDSNLTGERSHDSSESFRRAATLQFFSGFDDEHLRRLSDICHIQEFPARSTVFEEYEQAREVYVILSGQISLAICEPAESCKQIAVVHAGDLMGWSPLVGRTRLYDTAHALTSGEGACVQWRRR